MFECKGCDTPSCQFVCKRLISEMMRNKFLSLLYSVKHSDEKKYRDMAIKEIEYIFNEIDLFENIDKKKKE